MSAAPAPAPDRAPAGDDPWPDLICVGGLPGAGKTTAIRTAAAARPDLTVIDPDDVYRPLRSIIGSSVPYRGWRWLVHSVHTARLLGRLILGPGRDRFLVVHEPSTRSRRRRFFVRAARRLGWRPALLYVDTDPETSRTGQHIRGRVLPAGSFDRHCARWTRLAQRLGDDPGSLDGGHWHRVMLTDRDGAVSALRGLSRSPDHDSGGSRGVTPR